MNTHHAARTTQWLIIVTLVIAAFLRLWQIGALPPGLHYDEAADTIIAEQIARGESAPIFIEAYTGKEVLFFYWAAAWMKLIGPSVFAMRLAAALLGVLTVAATYRVVAEILASRIVQPARQMHDAGSKTVALLAAIFIATSFWHILMSRLGFRSISEPLIQALALAALFRGLRLNRYRWFVAAGVLVGLNLYTYLAARLFPIGIALIFLYFILFDRGHRLDRLTQFMIMVASAVIVFLPLGVYFVQHPDAFLTRIQQVAPRGDQLTPLFENALKALGMFFVEGDPYIRFNLPGRPLFPVVLGALFVPGVVVALIGMFRGRTVQRRGAYFSLIVLTLIMLLPTTLAVNEITPSNLRAIGLMPVVFVFPALGAWWLVKKIRTLIHADYA
ncbi:MAG: glycosyltransferase family 39 protein, partial [Chloroflexi bacterium]|nr:glycosyltransferase family 39 protein [Chloroflexota bacterium]